MFSPLWRVAVRSSERRRGGRPTRREAVSGSSGRQRGVRPTQREAVSGSSGRQRGGRPIAHRVTNISRCAAAARTAAALLSASAAAAAAAAAAHPCGRAPLLRTSCDCARTALDTRTLLRYTRCYTADAHCTQADCESLRAAACCYSPSLRATDSSLVATHCATDREPLTAALHGLHGEGATRRVLLRLLFCCSCCAPAAVRFCSSACSVQLCVTVPPVAQRRKNTV